MLDREDRRFLFGSLVLAVVTVAAVGLIFAVVFFVGLEFL